MNSGLSIEEIIADDDSATPQDYYDALMQDSLSKLDAMESTELRDYSAQQEIVLFKLGQLLSGLDHMKCQTISSFLGDKAPRYKAGEKSSILESAAFFVKITEKFSDFIERDDRLMRNLAHFEPCVFSVVQKYKVQLLEKHYLGRYTRDYTWDNNPLVNERGDRIER